MTMSSNHEHNQTPPELHRIEAALDRLARAERDAASPALEHRLEATLGAEASLAPIPIVRRVSVVGRLRMAAAIVLAGALVAVIGGRLAAPGPAPGILGGGIGVAAAASSELEEDVELWLALRSPDEFQGLAERLDLIHAETHALDSAVSGDWGLFFDSAL
jgi:hypothetical protein